MIPTPPDMVSLATVQSWYNIGKVATAAGAAVVAGYKIVRWFQDIRAKDLADIHSSVGRIETGMKEQTIAVVGELKELRNDMRTFYLPLASQARSVPKPVKKKTAKPKTKSRNKRA